MYVDTWTKKKVKKIIKEELVKADLINPEEEVVFVDRYKDGTVFVTVENGSNVYLLIFLRVNRVTDIIKRHLIGLLKALNR